MSRARLRCSANDLERLHQDLDRIRASSTKVTVSAPADSPKTGTVA